MIVLGAAGSRALHLLPVDGPLPAAALHPFIPSSTMRAGSRPVAL
jgi:hypothetical protein